MDNKSEKQLARIIKLIKALLAKADSTASEYEATAFTAKAKELLEKHNIKMHQLGLAQITEEVFDKPINALWQKQLSGATALYFGCEAFTRQVRRGGGRAQGAGLIFVGQTGAARTAFMMFNYFCDTILKMAQNRKKNYRLNVKDYNSYIVGCALGLSDKLIKLYQSDTKAQTDYEAAKQHAETAVPHQVDKRPPAFNLKSDEALRGLKDGLNISVNMQLG